MAPTFFTTHDGDIILRAGQGSDVTHDFRVHKFILSLASPVFKDMFTFPQNLNGAPDIPIVDIPDSPHDFDIILRFIYPGVEPPKVARIPTLMALLSAADKYIITSIYPVLKESLKNFLPYYSLAVYVIACRFGFSEDAKEAARVSTSRSIVDRCHGRDIQHISTSDLYRFVQFVQEREDTGLSKIKRLLGRAHVDTYRCDHWELGRDFYYHLEKEIGESFVRKPCLELGDLFGVFDRIPDPPSLGCGSRSTSAGWYDGDGDGAFPCPLAPMTIRHLLKEIATELKSLNRDLLEKTFEEKAGSG